MPNGKKWCPQCDVVKPIKEFPRAQKQANGWHAYCKPCYVRVIDENRAKNHGSAKNYRLRHRYGITEQDFDDMSAEQDGLCAVCREAPAAHVDHDHVTGVVRGLLCFNCNGALGQFRDRSDLMLRAVGYLRREAGTVFVELPGTPALYVGPDVDPRPPGESWPPELDDAA